jgi:hypothetical protein
MTTEPSVLPITTAAGIWGTPMWVFYVNRGQCISSFGIDNKDKSILEFQPANKAYRMTSLQGFRTFLKITSGRSKDFWEPFSGAGYKGQPTRQTMSMQSHDLTIEDVNPKLGLKVEVNYFTMPQEPFPALVRRVTVTHLGTSKKSYDIEMIDGLSIIMPYGLRDWAAKNMSRTAEA